MATHSRYDDSLPGYPLHSGVEVSAAADGSQHYRAWVVLPGGMGRFYPRRRSTDLERAELIRDLLVQTFLTIYAVTTA